MEDKPDETGLKIVANYYANYLRATLWPSCRNLLSTLLANLRIQRKHHPSLPLPLPFSSLLDSSVVTSETSRVCDVISDVTRRIFDMLHDIQKNLEFWQSKSEVSDARKLYFMILGRGPSAFANGIIDLVLKCAEEGSTSGIRRMNQSADSYISERINVLSILRNELASFIAEIYVEVDKHEDDLLKDPKTFFSSMLNIISDLFSTLEQAICHMHPTRQEESYADGCHPYTLVFEKFPESNRQSSQWTEGEIVDAATIVHNNLQKLEFFLSLMIAKHQKPKRITRYWIRYTCSAVGLSICSLWILRHSRLMGSSDIDDWLKEAKESTVNFFKDHVEQPILSIRDELFDTFRKRHKGMMEAEEVHLTATSLHRMLLAFSEQTKGQRLPENASDQEMMEIVMSRYEKELTHPIQNLVSGELARALLIQVQKLKLDIETAMLELNQILKANEINFAVLAALPAFFLSLVMLMVIRTWLQQDSKAEGRGRIGRRQRRLLLAEVEKKMMQHQIYIDKGLETESRCTLGLMLYALNRLFLAAEKHAKATGEWQSLKEDILSLTKPSLQTVYKLTITSRMESLYECMLPSLKRT